MTTTDSSSSGVRVFLSNMEMWEQFYPVNEMVVTRAGRKLFPELEVKIEGLAPDALYTVSLYLERVNNVRYKFAKDKKSGTGTWEEDCPVKEIFPIEKRHHMDGAMVGAHWMNSPVSFSNICITNNSNFEKNPKINPIFVQSLHKYQPVVTVKRLDSGFEEYFRLTMTEFMTVTAYCNPKIVELKKKNNKFCSGFLPGGKHYKQSQGSTPRGRKRAIASKNSNSTTPSKKPMQSQNQNMTPSAIAKTPSTMLTPPSLTSTPTAPSFGGNHNFQNQMMTLPNIVTPPSMASTYMTPPFGGSTGYQNQMMIPPYPNHHFAINQHFNPCGMPSTFQLGGLPMPPPTQWNMMPGANNSQNFAQFGNAGRMQQMNYNIQQSTNFNGAGTSSQQYSNGAYFNYGFH